MGSAAASPRVKVKKSELTRTQQADRQILGTDDDGFAHGSFARFFNSANARPARRPSLVALEFELLGAVCAALLESGEPAAEAGELIRRQLGNSLGDFFDFHVAQYSTPSCACGATDVPRTLTREYPAIV